MAGSKSENREAWAHTALDIAYTDDPGRLCASDLGSDLRVALEATLAGGVATIPFYRSSSLLSVEKSPGDPVTEADHAANEAVLAILRTARPADPVLSEEMPAPDHSLMSGRLWVVDPLDGTREFIAGIDEFAVMVGLSREGRSALGAVFVVGTGRLYLGLTAGGAWTASCTVEQDGTGISIGRFESLAVGSPLPGRIRLVRSRSHPDPLLQAIEDQLPGVEAIPSGSVGVKCARIAATEADLYVHPVPYLKEWDTCAPEAILRGAGGRVTDCGGQDLRYGKSEPRQMRGILAGDPVSWRLALPLVRRTAAALL